MTRFIRTTAGTWLNVDSIITVARGRNPESDGPRETLFVTYRSAANKEDFARCHFNAPVIPLTDVLDIASRQLDTASRKRRKK